MVRAVKQNRQFFSSRSTLVMLGMQKKLARFKYYRKMNRGVERDHYKLYL